MNFIKKQAFQKRCFYSLFQCFHLFQSLLFQSLRERKILFKALPILKTKLTLKSLPIKYLFGFLLVLAFNLSGCINNLSESTAQKQNLQTAPPSLISSSGGFSLVQLTRIVASSTDPQGSLDLLGDGSHAISNFCIPTQTTGSSSTSTSSSGASTCKCKFRYTRSNNVEESFESDTAYVEGDLLRCNHNQLPSDATQVHVSIHITTADVFSNEITLSFSNISSSLDLSQKTSFQEIKRIQCRDIIKIPYMFDGQMYDPIQSEDTKFSYPLNFYTSNLGGSIRAFFEASISDPSNLSKFECNFNDISSPFWQNLTLYSVGADSNGSKQIYPPEASAFDRHTFYLAKEKTGIFQVPIEALIAPTVLTTNTGTNPEDPSTHPLGYGARPTTQNGTETCPIGQVTIPSGFHWVKVWAFRASLEPRWYVSGSKSIQDTLGVFCLVKYPDPNNPCPADSTNNVFTDCSTGTSLCQVTALKPLADRVLGNTNMCVEFNPAHQAGQASNLNFRKDGFDDLLPGADSWKRAGNETLTTPLELKKNSTTANDFTLGKLSAPTDTKLFKLNLDNNQSRFDFVFVVSPPSITRKMIEDKTPGALPYIPYRFKNTDDCNAPDPDSNPTCLLKRDKKISYDLFTAEIGTDPGMPASPGSQNIVYPICALQPD